MVSFVISKAQQVKCNQSINSVWTTETTVAEEDDYISLHFPLARQNGCTLTFPVNIKIFQLNQI